MMHLIPDLLSSAKTVCFSNGRDQILIIESASMVTGVCILVMSFAIWKYQPVFSQVVRRNMGIFITYFAGMAVSYFSIAFSDFTGGLEIRMCIMIADAVAAVFMAILTLTALRGATSRSQAMFGVT